MSRAEHNYLGNDELHKFHFVLHGPAQNGVLSLNSWLFLVLCKPTHYCFISHYIWIKFVAQSTDLVFLKSIRRIHTSFDVFFFFTLLPSSQFGWSILETQLPASSTTISDA